MEKEKNKSKSHPFAGYLRPTEDVLWISNQSKTPNRIQKKVWAGILFGAVAVLASPMFGVDRTPMFEKFAIVLTLTILVAIVGGFFALVIFLFKKIVGTPAPERFYAVTNERLLYRNNKDVLTIPLEDVPSVSLFHGEGTTGTFSFGAFFPMWPDVKDAADIKSLIDEAQKQRLRDLHA